MKYLFYFYNYFTVLVLFPSFFQSPKGLFSMASLFPFQNKLHVFAAVYFIMKLRLSAFSNSDTCLVFLVTGSMPPKPRVFCSFSLNRSSFINYVFFIFILAIESSIIFKMQMGKHP